MKTFGLVLICGMLGTVTTTVSGAEPEVSLERRFSPPWHVGPMVPLPRGVQSLEVSDHDTPVWLEPRGKRRGSLLRGTRLAIYGSRQASGECKRRWYLIGPQAWVCGDAVEASREVPTEASVANGMQGLPYDYYFVGADGAVGYANRALFGEGIPDSQLEPGFAVALQQTVDAPLGTLGYSTNGLWLSLDDLVAVRGSSFQGVHAAEGETLDVVWTVAVNKPTWMKPNGKMSRRLGSRTPLHVLDRHQHGTAVWLRIGPEEWVRQSDVRSPRQSPQPTDLLPDERWIDVDLDAQILRAYVGSRVVFSTLVSTGRGVGVDESATPTGEHRIWVKLLTSDMTNVEENYASQYYAIEAVPWVMYFKAGYALHAAFWHDNFGTRRSHGCINLSPKDAAFLFHWTAPTMPSGWYAVHPTRYDLGTRIRVR
jgi:hypothetical protein